MTRRYARFDEANKGPALEIRQSGEVVGIIGTGRDLNRTVRSDIGVTSGIHYFEQLVWGEDDIEAVIGIVTGAASLSLPVGGDAHGIGYDLAAGRIKSGGADIATVAVAAKGDLISMRLDLQQGTLTIKRNKVEQAVIDVTPWVGVTWYIGTSLGSDIVGDLQSFLGAGQRAFYDPDPLAPAGWSIATAQINPLWLGSLDWLTYPEDSPPNQRVEGVIPLGRTSFQVVYELKFWPWSTGDDRASSTTATAAAVAILDSEHAYDYLISGGVRDLPVVAYIADTELPLSDAQPIGTFLLDKTTVESDMRKQLALKGAATRFSRPLQRMLMPPSVDQTAANRPYRISLGAVFSVEPMLYDAASREYNVHDDAILGVGFFRDQGSIFDTSVPDYWFTPDLRSVVLNGPPNGKLTIDLSSVGGDALVPPTNLAPVNLAGWDATDHVIQSGGKYIFSDSEVSFAGAVEGHLKLSAALGAMKTYRYKITINDMSGFFGGTGQRTELRFIRSIATGNVPALDLGGAVFTSPGTYTGTFTNFSAGTNDFYIAMIGTQSGADFVDMSDVIELFEVDTSPVDSANLVPIKLAPFIAEIMRRAGIADSEWDRASAEAIDDDTGYAGIGWHAAEQVPVSKALDDVLPSYGACFAQGRDGIFRVFRMVDPDSVTPMGTITRDDMLTDLRSDLDEAPGLTNQFGLQRNETVLDASDFVDNFDPPLGIDLAERARLSRRYREIVATAAPFADAYADAYNGGALGTRLVRVEDAQAEAERMCAIFTDERRFWPAKVPLDSPYDIGQVWTLQYPYYGLAAGKSVMIVRLIPDHIEETATLTLWG